MKALVGCCASGVGRRAVAFVLSLASFAAQAQLTDATQTVPHVPGGAIAKSLADQVGSGRGDEYTYDSSMYIITRDPAVDAVVGGQPPPQSLRSVQRHFLHATGLTHRAVRQIERARYATNLLRQGTSILDTVYEAGYFDQPHLTRSLKLLVGQTPVELARGAAQLSFLYKTERRP